MLRSGAGLKRTTRLLLSVPKQKRPPFWEDETAVEQDTNWIRGYAPRGKTPTILHDRRVGCGAPVMISAVNNQGLSAFAFQRSAVRRYSFIPELPMKSYTRT